MTVTEQLLRVYRVDLNLRGLKSRLTSAERFLDGQDRQISEIDTKVDALEGQIRQINASTSNQEGEIARLDERMAQLREQMNSAKTNREYQAFLSEVQSHKDQRDETEQGALEMMGKSEELAAQLESLKQQRTEREGVRAVAQQDRDTRAAEIEGRVQELTGERAQLAADVPGDALRVLEMLIEDRGDEAMAPVEIQDKRRSEFICESCMMAIPVELVSGLLTHGGLTRCASCGAILYLTDEVTAVMKPASSKR